MTMMVEGERSQLTETTLEKDLGIWFSSDLKPSEHVAKAVLLASQMLGLFRRTFTHTDIPLMRQPFIAMVRLHLEYGNASDAEKRQEHKPCNTEQQRWYQV